MLKSFFLLSACVIALICTSAEADVSSAKLPAAKQDPSPKGDVASPGLPSFSDSSTQVVGRLPYSNQWIYDRPSNYLYINYDHAVLRNTTALSGKYQTDYGAPGLDLISADFFARLFYLADPEGQSFARDFAVWGRYRLGLTSREGNLTDTSNNQALTAEKNSLLLVFGQVGLLMSYEKLSWFKPFIGFGYMPYYFRNNSSLPSAEAEGQGAVYGPELGFHVPLTFTGHGSLFAEIHENLANYNQSQILENCLSGDFGIGFVF